MIGFYPGSFDPVTRGHLDLVRRALAFCPRVVIGVGQNGGKNYLFSLEERKNMLAAALQDFLTEDEKARIAVHDFTGPTVDHAAQIGAGILVKGLRNAADYAHEEQMVLVNRRLAPAIDTVFLFTENTLRDVSSSVVKEMARAGIAGDKFEPYLTPEVRDALLARVG